MEEKLKPGQRVIVALRRMIADGELQDGERIAEIATAQRLGVSRMPVRTALRALEQEGLVVKKGARGYAARGLTDDQIQSATEVRSVLEGLAARLAASRPPSSEFEAAASRILAEGDEILASGPLDLNGLERYERYNAAFHELIVNSSGNSAIGRSLACNNHLTFAFTLALRLNWKDLAADHEHMLEGHRQHRAVMEAILSGDADEAERLMREHAELTIREDGNARVGK